MDLTTYKIAKAKIIANTVATLAADFARATEADASIAANVYASILVSRTAELNNLLAGLDTP
jgi:hypothetical protein